MKETCVNVPKKVLTDYVWQLASPKIATICVTYTSSTIQSLTTMIDRFFVNSLSLSLSLSFFKVNRVIVVFVLESTR